MRCHCHAVVYHPSQFRFLRRPSLFPIPNHLPLLRYCPSSPLLLFLHRSSLSSSPSSPSSSSHIPLILPLRSPPPSPIHLLIHHTTYPPIPSTSPSKPCTKNSPSAPTSGGCRLKGINHALPATSPYAPAPPPPPALTSEKSICWSHIPPTPVVCTFPSAAAAEEVGCGVEDP